MCILNLAIPGELNVRKTSNMCNKTFHFDGKDFLVRAKTEYKEGQMTEENHKSRNTNECSKKHCKYCKIIDKYGKSHHVQQEMNTQQNGMSPAIAPIPTVNGQAR